MENERIEALLEEAKEVHECWRKDVKSMPTQLNIIELLHCNENAHSRILAELLKYENGRFRASFMEMSGLKLDIKNAQIALEYPANVDNKNGRIDILIYKQKEYAIIVENKGNGAEEQSEQISRYVRALINEGYEKKYIYCLYLTQEGGMPSENSLKVDEAKVLGLQTNAESTSFGRNCNIQFHKASRLKPINYKYDILNWLRNYVLPNISYRDKILIDGLNHYIDYLETIYKLKKYNMTNINSHYDGVEDSSCISDLFDVSVMESTLVTILEQRFKNIGFDVFSYNKTNFEIAIGTTLMPNEAIVIYKKDEGLFSLGWTYGYDSFFEETSKNIHGYPETLFNDLDSLLKELKEKINEIKGAK